MAKLLGRYSYTNPGPWTAKILEFVSDVNAKIRESTFSNNLQVTAYISKSDGPISEITFKGKKKVILYIINYYLSHSDILQDFKATIKNKVL